MTNDESAVASLGRVRYLGPDGQIGSGTLDGHRIETGSGPVPLEAARLLAPATPRTVVCVARNYRHAVDVVPDEPAFFLKPPNTVTGPSATITPPTDRVMFEGELAVVIGERARNVPESDALSVVEGFTIANDLTNDADENSVKRKSFDCACPIGPAVVPPNEVPADARIKATVDGEERQSSTIDDLVFHVPELIADVTAYITLEPGDLLLTGTPAGRGVLEDGQTVSVTIEGLGTLTNTLTYPD